jgi:hypothetical protein
MGIISETISGTKIINKIESSNIVETEYDTSNKKLVVEFKNGTKYEYEDVPHQEYTRFRNAESQGKYFTTEISKNYKYKKL